MKDFLQQNQKKIKGALSCFDRLIFRGYLPVQHGWQMAGFLSAHQAGRQLKTFLTEDGWALKAHAQHMAQEAGRPYQYLERKIPMEQAAREMADRDGIDEGLVCIFAILEPCRTFSFRYEQGQPFCRSAQRKCLHLYYYFMDREFGLIHLKLQTWFPMTMQVYVNGQDWLARKLATSRIGNTQARQRVPRRRGPAPSPGPGRSTSVAELAAHPGSLDTPDQPRDGGDSEGDGLLPGDCPERARRPMSPSRAGGRSRSCTRDG
jgi:hypothetical protein